MPADKKDQVNAYWSFFKIYSMLKINQAGVMIGLWKGVCHQFKDNLALFHHKCHWLQLCHYWQLNRAMNHLSN